MDAKISSIDGSPAPSGAGAAHGLLFGTGSATLSGPAG